MPKAIPERWLKYEPIGKIVEGTRFVAFKVPLKTKVNDRVHEEQRLDAIKLLDVLPNLGLIIDLTDTNRYYNPECFTTKGVEHIKLKIPGKLTPGRSLVKQFKNYVEDYLRENEKNDKLIGVHCTHGVNRTGYLICNYMISSMAMAPDDAIQKFAAARGHKIERDNYIRELQNLGQRHHRDTHNHYHKRDHNREHNRDHNRRGNRDHDHQHKHDRYRSRSRDHSIDRTRDRSIDRAIDRSAAPPFRPNIERLNYLNQFESNWNAPLPPQRKKRPQNQDRSRDWRHPAQQRVQRVHNPNSLPKDCERNSSSYVQPRERFISRGSHFQRRNDRDQQYHYQGNRSRQNTQYNWSRSKSNDNH